jgi:hypothetical protein
MAISYTSGSGASSAPPTLQTSPEKYVSLGDLLDPTKPDNRDLLVNTYGDQGITGFLTLTGAVNNAGTSDEVQWWEEGRLHKTVAISAGGVDITSGATGHFDVTDADAPGCRLNDVLLTPGGQRLVVTGFDTTDDEVDFKTLNGANVVAEDSATTLAIIGNIYAQGTDQPSSFYTPAIQKYTNPYIITKETFAVNGSQATNIGWVNVGNGEYRWYMKGEMDTRKRFMNQREMMLLWGQSVVNTDGTGDYADGAADLALAEGNVTGSEGYFQAVERRGLVTSVSGGAQGTFADMSDIDGIILELDKEGAPAEYAMYLNRAASLDIDDMLAQGIATQVTAGLPGQFGAFNNDADMAVKLGFKSFTRGGYTFHKHDWKLLNDPNLGGISDIKGAMVPLANVVDARTGTSAPALEMNYKGTGGYNRDVEHWVRGSVLGYNNMSEDVAEFYYRSECNLVTRAANQHVLIK